MLLPGWTWASRQGRQAPWADTRPALVHPSTCLCGARASPPGPPLLRLGHLPPGLGGVPHPQVPPAGGPPGLRRPGGLAIIVQPVGVGDPVEAAERLFESRSRERVTVCWAHGCSVGRTSIVVPAAGRAPFAAPPPPCVSGHIVPYLHPIQATPARCTFLTGHLRDRPRGISEPHPHERPRPTLTAVASVCSGVVECVWSGRYAINTARPDATLRRPVPRGNGPAPWAARRSDRASPATRPVGPPSRATWAADLGGTGYPRAAGWPQVRPSELLLSRKGEMVVAGGGASLFREAHHHHHLHHGRPPFSRGQPRAGASEPTPWARLAGRQRAVPPWPQTKATFRAPWLPNAHSGANGRSRAGRATAFLRQLGCRDALHPVPSRVVPASQPFLLLF